MKYNLDNLFKNKLQEIKVDYKAEYWKEMEKMLDKEVVGFIGGTASGFVSSWFFKSAIIVTIVSIIGFGGYFYLNSENVNKVDVEFQPTVNANSINNPCDELLTPHENKVESTIEATTNYIPARLPFTADYSQYLISIENKSPNSTKTTAFNFNIYDYYLEVDEELIILERNIEPSRVDDNFGTPERPARHLEPKNIKPMEKPKKDVFGKKKGILYYLGIRK